MRLEWPPVDPTSGSRGDTRPRPHVPGARTRPPRAASAVPLEAAPLLRAAGQPAQHRLLKTQGTR